MDDETYVDATDAEAVAGAVRAFLSEGFVPGSIVSRDWLHGALGVPPPSTGNSYDAIKALELRFLGRNDTFQRALLVEHETALQVVRGEGYRVVPPAEQSTWASSEAVREVRRGLKKGLARATYVNIEALNRDEMLTREAVLTRMRDLQRAIKEAEAAQRRKDRYNELTQSRAPVMPEGDTEDDE
jgi:hypothetical protein